MLIRFNKNYFYYFLRKVSKNSSIYLNILILHIIYKYLATKQNTLHNLNNYIFRKVE